MFECVAHDNAIERFGCQASRSQAADVNIDVRIQRRRALEVAAADLITRLGGQLQKFSAAAPYFENRSARFKTLDVAKDAAQNRQFKRQRLVSFLEVNRMPAIQ